MNLADWTSQGAYRKALAAPQPILSRRTRRLAIVTLGTLTLAVAVLVWTMPDMGNFRWLLFVAVPLLSSGYPWLARRGTRWLARAPEQLLDERQVKQVHGAFRTAYRVNSAAVTSALALCFAAAVLDAHPVRVALSSLYVPFALTLWLPSMVLAWRMDDEEPEAPEEPGPVTVPPPGHPA